MGYGTLIYIAGIAGIDQSYYEAAELDGANKWQQITSITLPCLIPSIITLLLMQIGKIFYSDFGLFYQVPQNSGSLYAVTNTIDTYVYRALMTSGGIGRSSAAGVFQSVVGFTLVMISNLVVKKVQCGKRHILIGGRYKGYDYVQAGSPIRCVINIIPRPGGASYGVAAGAAVYVVHHG